MGHKHDADSLQSIIRSSNNTLGDSDGFYDDIKSPELLKRQRELDKNKKQKPMEKPLEVPYKDWKCASCGNEIVRKHKPMPCKCGGDWYILDKK